MVLDHRLSDLMQLMALLLPLTSSHLQLEVTFLPHPTSTPLHRTQQAAQDHHHPDLQNPAVVLIHRAVRCSPIPMMALRPWVFRAPDPNDSPLLSPLVPSLPSHHWIKCWPNLPRDPLAHLSHNRLHHPLFLPLLRCPPRPCLRLPPRPCLPPRLLRLYQTLIGQCSSQLRRIE